MLFLFTDGNYLAVGSHDNYIYLFTVSEDGKQYKKHGRLSGHSSYITHLDWSKDSQYLQSNSGDYEILYCKLSGTTLIKHWQKYERIYGTVYYLKFL